MDQNIQTTELEKFAAMADDWWDPKGSCRPLHELNPTRLQFITDRVDLKTKTILDIGCGGGILSESMARKGGVVTGIDATIEVIAVAKNHAESNQIHSIQYRNITVEELANDILLEKFDVITCLELLEHVPDPFSVIKAAATLIKPNGHLFFSTLNRTLKAYLFAILGAEYILDLLPHETHHYDKFIRPSELEAWLRKAGLSLQELSGIHYNPLTHTAKLNSDVAVNYIAYARKI